MRIREAIVVEGKYDVRRLSCIVDGVIVETGGFSVFNDKEKISYLRRLKEERGLILLLDSDGAGFLIRGRLSSILGPKGLKHAYIPDVLGKERRKAAASKEGKLGVEGMDLNTLRDVLIRSGATIEGDESKANGATRVTKTDLYELGLSGGVNSMKNRETVKRALGFPQNLSSNGFLAAINAFFDRESFYRLFPKILEENED